jgi:hypothetical protein
MLPKRVIDMQIFLVYRCNLNSKSFVQMATTLHPFSEKYSQKSKREDAD